MGYYFIKFFFLVVDLTELQINELLGINFYLFYLIVFLHNTYHIQPHLNHLSLLILKTDISIGQWRKKNQ